MTDGEISWEDTVDPWGCNSNPNIYEQYTRDPERTPFQWTGGTNAGFTNGSSTWLPLTADYATINVEKELSDDQSHLKIYKALVALRKSSKTLQNGSTKYQALSEDIFVVQR